MVYSIHRLKVILSDKTELCMMIIFWMFANIINIDVCTDHSWCVFIVKICASAFIYVILYQGFFNIVSKARRNILFVWLVTCYQRCNTGPILHWLPVSTVSCDDLKPEPHIGVIHGLCTKPQIYFKNYTSFALTPSFNSTIWGDTWSTNSQICFMKY